MRVVLNMLINRALKFSSWFSCLTSWFPSKQYIVSKNNRLKLEEIILGWFKMFFFQLDTHIKWLYLYFSNCFDGSRAK